MVSGIALSLVQLGFLTWFAQIVTGFLVGEVVSAVSNRKRTNGLAAIAFAAAVLGPPLGIALMIAFRLPPGVPLPLLVVGVFGSLGVMGFLLLVLSGVIASTRVKN